ncbi:winged helix-turn-helix transcriptional regulator [Ligilactobacillus murinus]|nr:winged helix-turn-helix transcriptional regulator [Ligilactobacillus murinus]
MSRVVYPVVPPKTEYSLTELGNSIVSLVVALCDRGEQYLDNF